MTSYESMYAERLHRWQDSAIQKIADKVAIDNGASLMNEASAGLAGSLPPLMSDLFNIRERIANFGRRQVNDELGRVKR